MRKRHLLLAVMIGAACRGVLAHGDGKKAGPKNKDPKEQKEWGIAGDARDAKRTVEIAMLDTMRFAPDRVEVKQGDTVRFTIRNRGRMLHEFVIGTRQENAGHAALMLKFPDMEHDEPYMAHVPPGRSGRVVWTFNRTGEFEFACLIAGHYQSGMVGTIVVTARSKT